MAASVRLKAHAPRIRHARVRERASGFVPACRRRLTTL